MPTEADSGAAAAPQQFFIDEKDAARDKAARDYRLQTRIIPRLRAAGLASLCAFATCYTLWRGGALDGALLTLNLAMIVYGALSWWLLRSLYRRVGAALAQLFLHLDLVFYLLAAHQAGGGFDGDALLLAALFLLTRVADQVGSGFRRAFYFSHVAAVAYGFYLGIGYFSDAPLTPLQILLLLVMLHVLGMYISIAALSIERLRNRTRRSVHEARRLLGELRSRSAELERLRHDAERASASKSEFLTRMSHEIRTPINGILGMTELLQSTSLNADQQRFVDAAGHSTEALLALVDDILDYASIDAGKLRLESRRFDPGELLDRLAEQFRPQARAKGLDFVLEKSARLPDLLIGDDGRLGQALHHLIANGIKFTELGGVTVRALPQPDREVAPGEFALRIEIDDSGIGIDDAQRQSIFALFAQADGSSTRRYGGTGLGLTVSRRLIEHMGGRIGVNSEPGRGSLFWVNLTLAMPDRSGQTDDGRGGDDSASSRPRLLVADDEPINRELILAMLDRAGFDADAVGSGQAALDALRQRRYALVLMDCNMPNLDGFAATAAIRRREGESGVARGQRLRIVALTASAFSEDRERCLHAGMDDYLSKPYSQADLAATVRRHLPDDDRYAALPPRPTQTQSSIPHSGR